MTGKRCSFDAFNVCTGKETSIKQLAEQVKAAFKSEAEIVHNPARDGDIMKSVCNPAKVRVYDIMRSVCNPAKVLETVLAWRV
jgi:nucleoside-diphosphate-sugar epimerase